MKYKCLICNKEFRYSAFNCCNVTWTNNVTKVTKLYKHYHLVAQYYHKENLILIDGAKSKFCDCGECPEPPQTHLEFNNTLIDRTDFYNAVDKHLERYLKYLVFM